MVERNVEVRGGEGEAWWCTSRDTLLGRCVNVCDTAKLRSKHTHTERQRQREQCSGAVALRMDDGSESE